MERLVVIPIQRKLLEDYVDINDLKSYPAECIDDQLKGQCFWTDHDQIIVFKGNLGFAANFLLYMGAENLLPELKIGNLWLFIDEKRTEVVCQLIQQWKREIK